jgi:MscS family membrane protein
MTTLERRVLLFVVCLAICLPAPAQSSLAQQILNAGQPAKEAAPADPLGRETPSGSLFGFLQAAQNGNYSTAAQYLQMSPAKRQAEGEELARKLKVVVDRAFQGSLNRISKLPDGMPQEGVPLDLQKVGTLVAGDVEADLILVHVRDANVGRIRLPHLISCAT